MVIYRHRAQSGKEWLAGVSAGCMYGMLLSYKGINTAISFASCLHSGSRTCAHMRVRQLKTYRQSSQDMHEYLYEYIKYTYVHDGSKSCSTCRHLCSGMTLRGTPSLDSQARTNSTRPRKKPMINPLMCAHCICVYMCMSSGSEANDVQ